MVWLIEKHYKSNLRFHFDLICIDTGVGIYYQYFNSIRLNSKPSAGFDIAKRPISDCSNLVGINDDIRQLAAIFKYFLSDMSNAGTDCYGSQGSTR